MRRLMATVIAGLIWVGGTAPALSDVTASERSRIEKAFHAYLRAEDDAAREKVWTGIKKLAVKLSIEEQHEREEGHEGLGEESKDAAAINIIRHDQA